MCRIDRLRRYQRNDIGNVVFTKLLLLGFDQGLIGFNADTVLGQRLENLRQQPPGFRLEIADDGVALFDLLLGRAAVHGEVLHTGADLQLEPTDGTGARKSA